MRSVSGTGSRRRRMPAGVAALAALAILAVLPAGGCSRDGSGIGGGSGGKEEKTVLVTRKGESSIKVTESEENGDQVVRVNTVFRGETNTIVLDIDQPVYEVEIPLSIDQVIPQSASAQVRGPEGQFQDLMIAQYLQKAQEAMVAGDYNAALRQVNTVLQVKPNHIQAHSMKGSVYYALGNYALAKEEWQYVLAQDPSNKEVQDFMDFLKNRGGNRPPGLPATPPAARAPARPPAPPSAAPPGAAGPGAGTPPGGESTPSGGSTGPPKGGAQ